MLIVYKKQRTSNPHLLSKLSLAIRLVFYLSYFIWTIDLNRIWLSPVCCSTLELSVFRLSGTRLPHTKISDNQLHSVHKWVARESHSAILLKRQIHRYNVCNPYLKCGGMDLNHRQESRNPTLPD